MNDKLSKHKDVSRTLATEILAGKYGKTGKLPSEIQLSARFKVSRPTIGRALLTLHEDGMVERRAGSGTYVVEADGKKTARSSAMSRQLGMLVPNLRHTEIFETICGELADLARVNDFGLWWGDHGPGRSIHEPRMTVAEAEELCERFIESRLSGVFVVPFEHQADREEANLRILTRLRQAGIPIVLIDRDATGFPRRSEYDLVGVDNFAGGYLLAGHLIKLGLKRLAYVTKPFTASTVELRIAGAQSAMLANGIEVPRDFVRIGDPMDQKFVRGITQSKRVEGILCTSDHIAAQLLQTLNRLKVRVPEDLRLVGFDDVRFANLLTIPLTTMQQPCRDIALTAFNCMRERIASPSMPARSIMLAPQMIVRETCGAYLSQKAAG
jgi:DNA-binding LacI/PurR family transcriptional regulator